MTQPEGDRPVATHRQPGDRAAFASRSLKNVREQLDQAGIRVFATHIVERAAYRDIFDYGGLLSDLPGSQVSNLENARRNAGAFAAEVLDTLKTPAV